MDLSPGRELGPYRLVERVGRGGMGLVYKAYQASLARYVAVKVLTDEMAGDAAFRTRFREEAISIAGLRHPNILAVFDYGEIDGGAYIVTEFIDGGTLDQQLGRPLPAHYVTEILKPVAAALDYAHARGVIHRDIKPSNILLSREGTPILADFGLARMIAPDREVTTAGMVLGTPNYMAPEQARGLPEPASDQYALAVVAYEMVTGRVPYSAPTPMGVVIAHQTGPLPPPRSVNPDVPEDVEAALVKALELEPEHRFASATGFLRALAQDTPSGRVVAPPASPPTPPAALPPAPPTALPPAAPVVAGGGGRRRWLLAGGAVLLLVAVIAGVAAFALTRGGTTGPAAPVSPKTVTWEQWKQIPGILDAQPTSTPGQMMVLAQGKLYLLQQSQPDQLLPYAQGQGGFQGAGGEPYLAVSPGLHLDSGCEFGTNQAFSLHQAQPFSITHIDEKGHASQLSLLTGVNDLNGLAFDTVGKFGQRLLAVSDAQDNAALTAIDCYGKATRITQNMPKMEGGMAVAPISFGASGGMLVGPDEFDGKIYAIDQNGQSRVVIDSTLPFGQDIGVESAGFVPPGFIGTGGGAYVADRATGNNVHPGTDTLLRLNAAALKDAGVQDGDLLVVTEGGGRTVDVHCNPTCTVREIGHATPGAHIEGHVIFLPG